MNARIEHSLDESNSNMQIQNIKFIRLGSKKENKEEDCLAFGKLVLGYREIDHFGNHKTLTTERLKKEAIEQYGSTLGVATRYAKQIRSFYDNDKTTLWITFAKRKVWWGMIDNRQEPYQDEDGYTYRNLKNGWNSEDINGNVLTFENISGALLKTQGFQGTICDIKDSDEFPTKEYTKRLISGMKLDEIITAENNKQAIEKSMQDLIRMLHPKDFEYIVDLIFQYSGWKKLTPGAGVEEFIDLDLEMPLTGERAVVQVKSSTNQQEYENYENIFHECGDLYDRLFYVYHSPKNLNLRTNSIKPIHILGIEKIAELIVELGLVSILMKKVS